MSSVMKINNALTGDVVSCNPDRFISLDDLKNWIYESQHVPKDYQLLLTARGAARLKMEAVVDSQEVFLFDRSVISASMKTKDSGPTEPAVEQLRMSLSKMDISRPPSETVPADSSMVKISSRILEHATWASRCLQLVEQCSATLQETENQITVIKRGVAVAMEHMMHHSEALQKSFDSKVDFAIELDRDMGVTSEWSKSLETIRKIILMPQFGSGSLAAWVDEADIRQTSIKCQTLHEQIHHAVDELNTKVTDIYADSELLQSNALKFARRDVERDLTSGPVGSILQFKEMVQDLDLLISKIQRDSQYVASLTDTPQHQKAALRICNIHQTEFFPQADQMLKEIWSILNQWEKMRHWCQSSASTFLGTLSEIQLRTSTVRPALQQVGSLMQEVEDLRAAVAIVVDLPFLYGALLIETVRRSHWLTHMKRTVSEKAEKMAEWRQGELDRRAKWRLMYGEIIPRLSEHIPDDDQLADVEVNFAVSDDGQSADVTSADIEEYFALLMKLGLADVCQVLRQEFDAMIQRSVIDLPGGSDQFQDKPTEHRDGERNGLRLFRSGTLAASREDEAASSRVRNYESRIRILEDLLHRQQYRTGEAINTSRSSREKSHSPSGSPSRLIEQVHRLETQKNADNQTMVRLEEENNGLRRRVTELEALLKDSDSTKTDLLANMTSQDTDFGNERKQYLAEISELKIRVEELEEELDRGDSVLEQENSILKAAQKEGSDRIEELEKENELLHRRCNRYSMRARDLSQRLFTGYKRSCEVLESMGLQASKEFEDNRVVFKVNRVKGLGRRSSTAKSTELLNEASAELDPPPLTPEDLRVLHWMDGPSDEEDERYRKFADEIYVDYDIFRDTACKRFKDVEHLARKLQKDSRLSRERVQRLEMELRSRLSLTSFSVGDLALFLPTRDPTRVPNPWAAFNVNAPHYFLRQDDSHQLTNREYLVARITKIEERVVNKAEGAEEDNPFDLSDGLKWYMLEATSEW